MDFARKQLEKYGWTDGKGLGKHENGIAQPLKPKIKRSVTGVGHDAAADFTEHWWTQLYNKAASNVEVEENNGNTKKIKTKEDEFEITNSTWKIKKKKRGKDDEDGQYKEYFVRKAVLTGGGSKIEGISGTESEEEEKETKDVFKMTDEELFAACEGRTAHKGARHGLKATGKLARIAQQEQMLLAQPQYNGYSHAKKQKKSEKSLDSQNTDNLNQNYDENIKEDDITKKKKKKKRRNSVSLPDGELLNSEAITTLREGDETNKDDSVANENIEELDSRKSKKSKKSKDVDVDSQEQSSVDIKNKKKKHKSNNLCDPIESSEETNIEVVTKKKKKLKKRDEE